MDMWRPIDQCGMMHICKEGGLARIVCSITAGCSKWLSNEAETSNENVQKAVLRGRRGCGD
jgi:hypothetical protein